MKQNPWLGLASYDEQAVAQGYKFCGRERAINELYSIVDNNLLTTLYGKSGIGKSSLLQAGVFPRLRTDNYLPVMIRLGAGIAGNYSYTTVVMDAVRKAVAETGGRCVATQEGEIACEEERLWHFFHSTEFQSAGGDTLFPVIVLDQFEELYYRDKQQLSTLLKALYLLVDDSPLSSSDEDEVPNYRIVLSIREDDLFHLEDSIDKLRLTEMKYNRYRLRELTDDEARDVILLPASELISAEERESIVDTIIDVVKGDNGDINSAILSLLCCRIFDFSQEEDNKIKGSTVISFLNSSGNRIFASFLEEIKEKISDQSVWYYLEDELITDEGRRNSVLKTEFEKYVKGYNFLFEGKTGILRNVAISSSNECRIEIIHDLFAQQMFLSRNERKLKDKLKKQRYSRFRIALYIVPFIISLACSLWLYMGQKHLREKNFAQLYSLSLLQEQLESLDIELKEFKYTISYNVGKAVPLEDSTYNRFIKDITSYKNIAIRIKITCITSPEGNLVRNESLAKARADTIAKRLNPYFKNLIIQTSGEVASWSEIATQLDSLGYSEEANIIKESLHGNGEYIFSKVRTFPIYRDLIIPLLNNTRCTKCIIALSHSDTKDSGKTSDAPIWGISN